MGQSYSHFTGQNSHFTAKKLDFTVQKVGFAENLTNITSIGKKKSIIFETSNKDKNIANSCSVLNTTQS